MRRYPSYLLFVAQKYSSSLTGAFPLSRLERRQLSSCFFRSYSSVRGRFITPEDFSRNARVRADAQQVDLENDVRNDQPKSVFTVHKVSFDEDEGNVPIVEWDDQAGFQIHVGDTICFQKAGKCAENLFLCCDKPGLNR